MPWSGIASHTTKEWFRTSQNEKWSHETEQTNTMEFKKECSWYVLILLILARGCRPFSHFRLPNSTMALSNLSPSLLLSWSKGLGNVSPLSAKGTPTPTVLMASSPWSTSLDMSSFGWLLVRLWRFKSILYIFDCPRSQVLVCHIRCFYICSINF